MNSQNTGFGSGTDRFNLKTDYTEPVNAKKEVSLSIGKIPKKSLPRSKSYQPKKFSRTNPTFPRGDRFKHLYKVKKDLPGPGSYNYDVPLYMKRLRDKN